MAHKPIILKLRGIMIILAGIVLLLYNFGFFQKLGTAILVLISLYLVVTGFFDAGYYHQLIKRVKSLSPQQNSPKQP